VRSDAYHPISAKASSGTLPGALTTSTFSFAGLELRCVTIDGQPWFVAADVLDHLGILKQHRSRMIGRLDPAERGA